MPRRGTPWISGPALGGATAGVILSLAVRFLPSWSMPPWERMALLAAPIAAYAIGVLLAYRRRDRENGRLLQEMQEELRFSQDHIMENETYRSLSAYLEIAAHQMREPMQGLLSGLRALAAKTGLPEDVRESVTG